MVHCPSLSRRHVVVTVVTLLVAAAAGCGSEPKVDPLFSADTRTEVQAMLQERARRLTAGDIEGYLAPLSPEARAVEEPIAMGAIAVPLAGVDLTMDEADFPDGDRVEDARVDFVYRYKGLGDDNVFRFRINCDMERREGAWTVTRSAPKREDPPLPIWATGPVEVRESPHFTILHRPDLPKVDENAALAEQGRAEVVQSLTLAPDDRHIMVLARDEAEMTEFVGPPAYGAVAVTSWSLRPTNGHESRPEDRWMAVNSQATEKLEEPANVGPFHGGRDPNADDGHARRAEPGPPEVSARQIFEHELGHLILTRFTRRSTPPWVREAGSMRLSKERRIDSWRRLADINFDEVGLSFAGGLTASQLGGPEYAYVNAAAFYLVETYGIEKFWAFYRDFKEYDNSPNEAHPLEDMWRDSSHRLLKRIYDLTEKQLDAATRDYLRQAAAAPA